MPGPLSGCKVIELAHIMAGPVAGLMLADMGAEVIKVEKPGGDESRRMAPPAVNGESAAYMMVNRGKRGICIDLRRAAGRAVMLKLLADADVLIENHRRGVMAKLGLGHAQLQAVNPGLIYLEILSLIHIS